MKAVLLVLSLLSLSSVQAETIAQALSNLERSHGLVRCDQTKVGNKICAFKKCNYRVHYTCENKETGDLQNIFLKVTNINSYDENGPVSITRVRKTVVK